MTTEDRNQENRLRQALARQGMKLMKSRCRTPEAVEYGGYMIVNASTNWVEAGGHPSAFRMNLDDVETWVKD